MRALRALLMFAALLAFWQTLSARVDPLFLVLGVLSAAGSTWFASRLIEPVVGSPEHTPRIDLWHLTRFLVWLLLRIPPAGVAIARVVLDPRRPPRPGVFRFRTGLASPAARTLLANAITLVPGTMTLNVEEDEFTVHAFTPDAAADLATAAMQRRIALAFRQPADQPPAMVWDPVHDELPDDPS
jgi:multicomponent Na+:H+ antiporter subunit E